MVVVGLALGACKSEGDEPAPPRREEQRTIVTLQSYVYATTDDTSFKIAERVRDQIKSAFGALKSLRVTGSNKEVSNGADGLLYREPVVLVAPSGGELVVLRVWYRFSDEVTAPGTLQRGVPILVGGLHNQNDAHFTEIVTACTPNTAREREYRGRLQGVFDGSLPGCQDAILAEQSVIEASRVRLDSPEEEIVPEEFRRVYVPVVARLMEQKASQMGRYPRFETVIPQAGRAVAVAAAPSRTQTSAARAAAEGRGDESEATPESPGDRPSPIVVPGGGGGAKRQGPAPDEPSDPDAPPDPQAGIPVVGAASPASKNPSAVVQPRQDDLQSSFNWEDLLDKKFLVMWLAVFALYPLLRRRSSGA